MTEDLASVRKKIRILFVDDDPIMRELAAAKLAEAGYQVTLTPDGAQALEALKRDDVNLVISDLDMPHMNGYALTREIRKSAALADTPVIVITSSDHSEAVDEAFAAGATSFVAKPINWTLFSHAVRFVLKASEDQAELRVARDQAEAGARFKDSLMSIMSHELRTPLNAIIGFGQILSEQFERENDHLHQDYAEYIVEGGKRLLNSVSDMLLASEAQSDPITINEVDCTIGEIIDLAAGSVAKAAALAEADLSILLQNREQELCCDRSLVARAITKLLENSVKFSQRGVRVVVGAGETPDGRIAILVKDNGPGIAADKIDSLRQPFAQMDMSLKRSKEGLGLGLPLVQAIAAAHSAEFRLDSAPGAGTRAVFVIPKSRVIASPARTPRKGADARAS
ncbi:MAG TPA: hybrid sensor histidine kinase/response regulator [Parvularculaceae bacterium]|nr:hybrid sensor histidine kinase/response regulator [Parvularculaceae bacterium]